MKPTYKREEFNMLKFNYENSSITDKMINSYSEKVAEIHKGLNEIANDIQPHSIPQYNQIFQPNLTQL